MSIEIAHALLQPSAYPHAVDEIRLVETHLSWVFLTGPFAYKVKKPVSLDFVDFSTLGPSRALLPRGAARQSQLFPTPLRGGCTDRPAHPRPGDRRGDG